MEGARILVNGATGNIGLPLVEYLSPRNDVWAVARYGDAGRRRRVEASGATAFALDFASGDFSGLPADFDYVIHLVTSGGRPDSDHVVRVDGEGTALLLQHCRKAKAALVMSSGAVYRASEDRLHHYAEGDPLGEGLVPGPSGYPLSKHVQESAARSAARLHDLPVVIARMGTAYGSHGGLPTFHLDAIMSGRPVTVGPPDALFSPIHQDDVNTQMGSMLAAAGVPATVVNWGGDEVVGPREWCAHIGELTGRQVRFEEAGGYPGCVFDSSRRKSITGPCEVPWREGLRRTIAGRYPDMQLPPGHRQV